MKCRNPSTGLSWPLRLVFLTVGALVLWSIVGTKKDTGGTGAAPPSNRPICARPVIADVTTVSVKG